MRYLFNGGEPDSEPMHIEQTNILGEPLNKSVCGKFGFNRSINAPFGLGKKICADCQKVIADYKSIGETK